MASRSQLTIETLTKLGARKLAELLLAEAARNRLKQTLSLAISAKEGPAAVGASLRKRLGTLASSSSMLSYERGRELIGELDGLRTTINETVGAKDPALALDLLWQFLDLPSSIRRHRAEQDVLGGLRQGPVRGECHASVAGIQPARQAGGPAGLSRWEARAISVARPINPAVAGSSVGSTSPDAPR